MQKTLILSVIAAGVVGLTAYVGAQGPTSLEAVKADYDRANSLRDRTANKVYHQADAPVWIGTTTKFWYRTSVKGGNEFVLVDAAAATKAPAFDHTKLATGINALLGGTVTAVTLPFTTFTYADNQTAIEFAPGGGRAGGAAAAAAAAPVPVAAPQRVRCSLTDYVCTRLAATANGAGGPGRGGRAGAPGAPAPGAAAEQFKTSPDGKSEAFIQNFNVFVRPVGGGRGTTATALSWEGSEGNYYTFQSIQWAPDSKKIAAYRRVPGYNRQVSYVQSSPTDQLQPKSSSRFYRKPGDTVDIDTPVVFNLDAKKQTIVDNTLFPNPYSNQRIEWRKDSRAFTFEYNQRGHQVYRVIEVDAATGKARGVIEEMSKTFIDYRRTAAGLTDSSRMERFDIADGKEVIWMSERDGWAHLYLYDGVTGQLKQQITKGNWAVHHVEKVDEAKRQIWFTANGMDAGKDPYLLNSYRINFDGTGLTRFTTADAMHTVTWSPDQQYYVDTYSRVDLAPVTELHRTSDQQLVLALEKADTTDLLATGWKTPEVFVSKGRDGVTDIWGIIIRPTNFDPTKKYPVIENIYAGPQGSFVPKTFSTQTGMQTLAELGFIVVQIDGMGTANRSKAFHDVAWKDLADAGFPDRILWHKAVAAKYPSYDITRVGIYGTSAGGQNSAGAMLFHPEFYKVAVSNSGCHDNRMDKIWWNEQWMGWPIGPEYAASSNVDHAAQLQGHLMLVVGEMDTNVDPSSTMQVVNALVQASKEFELVVVPGADHGAGSPITVRKRNDFFVRYLRGVEPPNWNNVAASAQTPGGSSPVSDDGNWSALDEGTLSWVASEDWELIDSGPARGFRGRQGRV